MNVGDRVKIKLNGVWYEGTIICVYVVPKDYNLVDVELEHGETIKGVSTKDLWSLEPNQAQE